MKTNTLIMATSYLLAALFLTTGVQAGAGDSSRDGKYSFRLESNSRVLPTYYYRGHTYVEGKRGQRYDIRVYNHTGRRVEAVVTVDGRDVITGKNGNYRKNRGYVISPYSSVLIEGFRTSYSDVADFYFTDIEDSYAARMGSLANVGVVGVAVFEERRPGRYRRPPPMALPKRNRATDGDDEKAESAPSGQNRSDLDESELYSSQSKRREGIGTGYGRRRYSPATKTHFSRRRIRPDARLAIYYDDREGLISRGVLPRPRPPRPCPCPYPTPFPENSDPGFAPPPPPYYRD